MVCACAVGLRGNVLIGMRGTWGVVWRSAHVSTIPFVTVQGKSLGPNCACVQPPRHYRGLPMNACVLYPMRSREFYDHIWALKRHLGHMTYMLDSDWLKNPLLRSDWLSTEVALYTTHNVHVQNVYIISFPVLPN